MSDIDKDQKTEQPTQKRLAEAMDKGQFAKSHELTVVLVLGSALGVFAFTARSSGESVAEYATGMFTRFAATHVGLDTVTSLVGEVIITTGKALLPILVACV